MHERCGSDGGINALQFYCAAWSYDDDDDYVSIVSYRPKNWTRC